MKLRKWPVRLRGAAVAARYKLGRLCGRPSRRIVDAAEERFQIEPAGRSVAALRPIIAERHLARIRGGFEGADRAAVLADINTASFGLGPVEMLTVRDAYVFGDAIVTPRMMYLQHRQSKLPSYLLGDDVASVGRVGFGGTYAGSRWFGHLLHDDFPAQLELERHAPLVLNHRPIYAHEPGYRELLSLKQPTQYHILHARELLVLSDVVQSADKTRRYRQLRERVDEAIRDEPGRSRSRGVFILRGMTGEQRVLVNEAEVAARLEREGFRVIDPAQLTARQIVTACADAEVVCGIEGSQLMPAFLGLPTNGLIVPINPPTRATLHIPRLGGFFGLNTAMVVAEPAAATGEAFKIDPEEFVRSIADAQAELARDPKRAEAFVARVLGE